jgi:hypothetical protein
MELFKLDDHWPALKETSARGKYRASEAKLTDRFSGQMSPIAVH